jgi:hypothetical protein
MMRLRLLILFILCSVAGFAQSPAQKLVQFSGVVYNADSNTVVPYVTITNKTNRNQIQVANYKGYFSFVAHERDTIIFSAVGYHRQAIVIPATSGETYTAMVKLKQEVINLPMVRVYPWASTDEFKKDFLTMKFADDDLEIAKKNVSRTSILAISASLPRDGVEMQGYSFQDRHNAMSNKNINQRNANPLLNPFAWGALIQQISRGDKSRNQ